MGLVGGDDDVGGEDDGVDDGGRRHRGDLILVNCVFVGEVEE